jgi:hypothetical protein
VEKSGKQKTLAQIEPAMVQLSIKALRINSLNGTLWRFGENREKIQANSAAPGIQSNALIIKALFYV